MNQSLLRLPEVMARTGMARSSVYRLIALGRFPAPVKLSERTSAWPASEVTAWIDSRISAARGGSTPPEAA